MRGWVALGLAAALVAGGCSSLGSAVRSIAGLPDPGEPSALKPAETRWLLIKNPRYGKVPSEPEYVWVEEDKVPTTLTTLVRGKRAIIAPPEIVAKYGPPPGGGRISPRQGMPVHAEPTPPPVEPAVLTAAPAVRAPAGGPAEAGTARPLPTGGQAATPTRGWVVYVDTTRIVIDLTASAGVQPGTLVSVRRDRIPLVHPVTGELLGELDEEVATARVTEVRDKFSVAEIQQVSPGAEVQVRDRVVVK
jgi:hypothetical protein